MSIEYCHECDQYIDTDFDMEPYHTREVLPEDYQAHLDQPLSPEKEAELNEWVKRIPF